MSPTFMEESINIIIPETKSLNKFCKPKPIPTNKAAEPAITYFNSKPRMLKKMIKAMV